MIEHDNKEGTEKERYIRDMPLEQKKWGVESRRESWKAKKTFYAVIIVCQSHNPFVSFYIRKLNIWIQIMFGNVDES